MDLFHEIGLNIIPWDKEVKIYTEGEQDKKIVKECILNDNQNVLLLELKSITEIAEDNFYKLFFFMNNPSVNFLKIKSILTRTISEKENEENIPKNNTSNTNNFLTNKEETKFFYVYEKAGISLNDYMTKTNSNNNKVVTIEKRLFIYKQVIEIVYSLIYNYKDDFLEFEQSFFYVCEVNGRQQFSTNNNNASGQVLDDTIPILKIIYHGKINFTNNANNVL